MELFRRIANFGRLVIPAPRLGPWGAFFMGAALALLVGWPSGMELPRLIVSAVLAGCLFVAFWHLETTDHGKSERPRAQARFWVLCLVFAILVTVAVRVRPVLGAGFLMLFFGVLLILLLVVQLYGAIVLLTSTWRAIARRLRRQPQGRAPHPD